MRSEKKLTPSYVIENKISWARNNKQVSFNSDSNLFATVAKRITNGQIIP